MRKTGAEGSQVGKNKREPQPSRRDQIIAATEQLLRTNGLAGATTKQIAATAGCSEGAIYVHFKGRVELFMAVLEASLPGMLEPLKGLQSAVGANTPEQNLASAAQGIFHFHQRVTPMLSSLFAEPQLLLELRKALGGENSGPHKGIATLANYIRAEQKLGRIKKRVDADTAATMLMSTSFFRAYTESLFGTALQPEARIFFRRIISVAIVSDSTM